MYLCVCAHVDLAAKMLKQAQQERLERPAWLSVAFKDLLLPLPLVGPPVCRLPAKGQPFRLERLKYEKELKTPVPKRPHLPSLAAFFPLLPHPAFRLDQRAPAGSDWRN